MKNQQINFSNKYLVSINLMRSVIVLFMCCINMLSLQAQESAYYMSNLSGIDMVRVNTNTAVIEEIISFKDTVKVRNEQEHLHVEGRVKEFLNPKITTLSSVSGLQNGRNTLISQVDSIQVNGIWHCLKISFHDDGFVGGSPNQVDMKINVDNLGLIYSYSNFRNAHSLIMMYHENPEKQEIVTKAHSYLAKNKGDHSLVNWTKTSALLQQYTFQNVINVLRNRWMRNREDLKITSQKSEFKEGMIALITTVKNVSKKGYYFQSISPAELTIYYNDRTETNNLVDGYNGSFLKGLREPVYLNPGEETTLTQKLPRRAGTGESLTYKGLKTANYRHTLFNWLLDDVKQFKGKEYHIYPLREIKKAH